MRRHAKAPSAGSISGKEANRLPVGRSLFAALLSLGLLVGLFAAPSVQAQRAVVGSFGTPNGEKGGQLILARGVAVNRSGNGAPAGSVYVAEANANHRISQFGKDGNFIRTWGYDVIDGVNFPGAPNNNGTGFEICDVTNGNTAQQCKKGVGLTGPAAGQIANPGGIAIDQSNGYLYVTSQNNRRVDVFSGTGQFAGAFGFDVVPADPNPSGPDFCTTATGCQAAAAAGENAGRFSNLSGSIPAVDPSTPGKVYVPDPGNLRVNQYSTTITAGVLTSVSFEGAFGWDTIPANATTTLESCTIGTTCKKGSEGNGAGQFATGGAMAAGVDSTGAIYVISAPSTCSAATSCRIQKFAPDAGSATDFGPTSGDGQLVFTSGASNAVAAHNLAIDPSNNHVFVLRKQSTTTYRVLEYDSAGVFQEASPSTSLTTSGTNNTSAPNTGLAVGTDERLYVNYGAPSAGEVFILAPLPPAGAKMLPVEESTLTATTAELEGEVTVPELSPGVGAATKYHFEYSRNGIDWTNLPEPDASAGSTPGVVPVSVEVTGLSPKVLYQVRLVATTAEATVSNTVSFETDAAAPLVSEAFAEAGETEATLAAFVNPQSSASKYHFEWGPTPAYGNRVPAFERGIGNGTELVLVNETIAGLQPHTDYYFRILATNPAGETIAEGELETLNAAGLPDNRGIELVSPADKQPAGSATHIEKDLNYRTAEDGNSILYKILNGLADSTFGGEVHYQASRSAGGWLNEQASPASLLPAPSSSVDHFSAKTARISYASPDLKCAVVETHLPLTDDTPVVDIENGVVNLYRRSAADGSYTLITNRVPPELYTPLLSFGSSHYQVAGASSDCSRIFFRSKVYTFLPGASGLYEWDEGTLREALNRPEPDGSVPTGNLVAATGAEGQAPQVAGTRNNVTADGRLFFAATSNEGSDAGKAAIFMRNGPGDVVDVSQPAPGKGPTLGAQLEAPSPDGSKVLFTANYGLAATSSSGPAENCMRRSPNSLPERNLTNIACDLYRYDVESGQLTDLSATSAPANIKGAVVQGVLDLSEDGSVVYFAARGQLVPNEGLTYAENLKGGGFANIYRYDDAAPGNHLTYVGSLNSFDLNDDFVDEGAPMFEVTRPTSQTNEAGTYLLYGSRNNVTGTNPAGVEAAYLFSAESGKTVCVSCPRDGSQPRPPATGGVIAASVSPAWDVNPSSMPRALSEDGRVIFAGENALTPGAIEGQGTVVGGVFQDEATESNIYEWHEGQISLLASGQVRHIGMGGPEGRDVFIKAWAQLDPRDIDFSADVYDIRAGGGFAPPAPPPVGCDPAADQCQGTPTPQPLVRQGPPSATFSGPGNQSPAAQKKKKKKRKQGNKKKQRKRNGQKRAAKSNRGGAK